MDGGRTESSSVYRSSPEEGVSSSEDTETFDRRVIIGGRGPKLLRQLAPSL
jgi:hypothetical protein